MEKISQTKGAGKQAGATISVPEKNVLQTKIN